MKDEKEKQLLYDIQREKDSQKQVELVKTFVASNYENFFQPDKKASQEWNEKYDNKIVSINPVSQINEASVSATGLDGHKFAIGTKIQFPTFEKLRLEGWVDDGESMVHPIYKSVFLSYMQIADFEDTEVTISHQNNPGEYSIEEDGLYDDWPFDLMNVVKKSEKLDYDDQSLQEQVFHILHYLESEPNQLIIPHGRVRLLKETLGDYRPYDEVCYLPQIKSYLPQPAQEDKFTRLPTQLIDIKSFDTSPKMGPNTILD